MEIEIWREVVGYEDGYEVSSLGQVRHRNGNIVKQHRDQYGYPKVRLSRHNHGMTYRVHVLVASAFLGKRPPECETHHIDGNKQNNSWPNLAYVSHEANVKHAVTTGLWTPFLGEEHWKARLTEENVRDIRQRYSAGETTQAQLAVEYHVRAHYIWKIVHGYAWRHIPLETKG